MRTIRSHSLPATPPSSNHPPAETMKTNEMKFPALEVIDLDSPWFFGVARKMTDAEREEARKHGVEDDRPMSVMGVTSEGLAAVEGKHMASLFAAAPELLESLQAMVEEYGRRYSESSKLMDAEHQNHVIKPAMEAIARATTPTTEGGL